MHLNCPQVCGLNNQLNSISRSSDDTIDALTCFLFGEIRKQFDCCCYVYCYLLPAISLPEESRAKCPIK